MPDTGRAAQLIRRGTLLAAALLLLWLGLGDRSSGRAAHRARWLDVDGHRLRVLEAGRGDTTLVFLHGYGESLLAWRQILDRFTRDYRIVAVDLPGFGLSDKELKRADFDSYRRVVGELVAHSTQGPVVLVGHSMGGQIAAAVAMEHPDRVVAAVLIAPAGAGLSALLTDSGLVSPGTHWVATAMPYLFPVHDTTWMREPPGEAAYDPAEDTLASDAARRVLEQFDFAAIGDGYRDLRQPVLLIWGRQDPTIPFAIGERIAALLPCRRFVPLLALHRPHQANADTVAAEMRAFLRRPACGPVPN